MASGGSSSEKEKDKDSRWYFTAEQLANSPSRKCGIEADTELTYRQQAANLIQGMGQQLHVSQLCINTAIVYMHRFYAFHSFTVFHRNGIAQASLFLAAKVEEQPRKLEHVIKEANKCLLLSEPTKEQYAELAQDLVFNENVLLQTLGFDVAIDHPHTHVVKTCHLVKASKDLAQTSYFMASNSLHLTTMCLQYKPTVVACFCIHLACKWSRWEIPQSTERKHWFQYVDKTVTLELLQKLTDEFLHIFDRCPSRLKTKMKSMSSAQRIENPEKTLPGPSSGNSSQGEGSSSNHHHRHHHSHHHGKVPHDHHSSKQSATQIPGSSQYKPSHSISSSGSNRPRSDRPPLPPSSSSYVPTMNPQLPQHNSSNSKNMPIHPSSSSSSSSSSNSRPIPSSSSSQKMQNIPGENLNYPPPIPTGSSSREMAHKNRSMPPPSTNSSMMGNHKLDQRHLMKDSSSSSSSSKNDYKNTDYSSKSNMMKTDPNLFVNSRTDTMKSSSNSKQVSQSQHGSQIQSNSSSNRMMQPPMPPPSQQQITSQQSHPSIEHVSSQKPITESFKLVDDTNHIVEPMQICTPPKQSKPTSIFSPDYKDTNVPIPISSSNSNNSRINNINQSIKGNKDSPTSSKNKMNYPYDRRPDTPKKDKKLVDQSSSNVIQKPSNVMDKKSSGNTLKKINDGNNGMSGSINQFLAQQGYDINQGKISSGGNSNMNSGSSNKRPFAEVSIKQEMDYREMKLPKLELEPRSSNASPQLNYDPNRHNLNISTNSSNSFDTLYSTDIKTSSKQYSSTVNGIETNPDVISSLLKEACSDYKFGTALTQSNISITPPPIQNALPINVSSVETEIKIEPHMKMQHQQIIQQPLPKISPIPVQPEQIHVQNQPQIKLEQIDNALTMPEDPMNTLQMQQNMKQALPPPQIIANPVTVKTEIEDIHRSKSEKKKKKDKHKHKEKEKSKEERKKHKKDKDRHRDRDKEKDSKSPVSEPTQDAGGFESRIRITIPKDKLSLPSTESTKPNSLNNSTSSFKIKISKDIIKPDVTGYSSSSSYYNNEHISTGIQQNSGSGQSQQQQQHTSSLKIKIPKVMIENCHNSHSDNVQVHRSSKKKDRDRDRDREKNKLNKSGDGVNFNGNSNDNGGNNTGGQMSRNSTSSSSNQNKPLYINNNLSEIQQNQYHQNSIHNRNEDPNKFNVNNFHYKNRLSTENKYSQ